MNDFSTILQIALATLSIASLTGVGWTWGRVRGLEQRATSSEAEAVALRARVGDRDQTITTLQADIDALGRVVTGEAHLVALGHQIEEHHEAAEGHWGMVERTLVDMLEALRRPR